MFFLGFYERDCKLNNTTGEKIKFEGYDPHLIAGLLKKYFIDLPEPLLTFDLYDQFIEAAGKIFFFIFVDHIYRFMNV